MAKPGELTPKQQAFVREYLVDLNATQAAIRAGYAPTFADQAAPRLLGNVRIATAVQIALDRTAERNRVTVDEVIGLLRREANYNGEGASHGARVSAAGLLAKHVGMLVERSEHHEQREITVTYRHE